MNRFRYILLGFLILLPIPSCTKKTTLTLGYTLPYTPITLSIDNYGNLSVSYKGQIATPYGIISLTAEPEELKTSVANHKHSTIIEIMDRKRGVKHIFQLVDEGETVECETKDSHISIRNEDYYTVITVDSEEISNLLHQNQESRYKPQFPDSPIEDFSLTKKFYNSVNWETDTISDYFADAFYGFILIFVFEIDFVIFIFCLMGRFFYWLYLLVAALFA